MSLIWPRGHNSRIKGNELDETIDNLIFFILNLNRLFKKRQKLRPTKLVSLPKSNCLPLMENTC